MTQNHKISKYIQAPKIVETIAVTQECFIYPCHLCGEVFSSEEKVNSHTQIHTKEVEYGFTLCEQMFRSLEDLNNHEQVHNTCAEKRRPHF